MKTNKLKLIYNILIANIKLINIRKISNPKTDQEWLNYYQNEWDRSFWKGIKRINKAKLKNIDLMLDFISRPKTIKDVQLYKEWDTIALPNISKQKSQP